MRVLIIGGGIGGLCLANGLQKASIDFTVFESQGSPFENLAGYGVHIDAHGRRALQNCLDEEGWQKFEDVSTAAGTTMTFRGTDFRLLAERDDADLTGRTILEAERRGVGRLELREILLQGLRGTPTVKWGKAFTHYERLDNGRVRAYFADGTVDEGDILVGAEGSRSRVQRQYLPHMQREDLGITAVAGRYVLNKERIRQLPVGLTNGSLNNIVPDGKGWMFCSSWNSKPSDKTKPEQYVVWAYVISKEDTPANVKSLNPGQLRDIALAGMRDWSPSLASIVRDADLSTVGPVQLKCMPHLEPWSPSTITLLGDAIHNMPPTGGLGANLALRDGDALANALVKVANGEGIALTDAIGSYESGMRDYANAAVDLSRSNAINAASGKWLPRKAFRMLLKLSQASPPVMRATIGKAVVKERFQVSKVS